jgi:cell division protein FtsQ
MSEKAHIIWKTIGVTLVALLLFGAMMYGYYKRPSAEPCEAVEYTIVDRKARLYVTETEMDEWLKAENLYPVGRPIDVSVLHRIEQRVQHHPMIRRAECFATPRNEVRIHLTQRVPLLRVQMPGETYLIDTDRRVMEARGVVKDSILMVTGAVGQQMAATQLADFALWLQGNRYWNQRINHIHLQTPQNCVLYLRGTNQPRVVLGNMRGFEGKLDKLRTFLENSSEATEDKHYRELDIRFRGQVIGRE